VVTLHKNILSVNDIESIIDFYYSDPGIDNNEYGINKNLEYHIPDNFIHQLFNPILSKLIGNDHVFDTGSVKESYKPYPLHVDTRLQHDKITGLMSFGTGIPKYNLSVLVPLVEGPEFRTVVFNSKLDNNPKYPAVLTDHPELLGDKNYLKRTDFMHLNDLEFYAINHLEIDVDYTWETGDILIFSRDQLHISADFSVNNLIKKFLIFFIE